MFLWESGITKSYDKRCVRVLRNSMLTSTVPPLSHASTSSGEGVLSHQHLILMFSDGVRWSISVVLNSHLPDG